MEKTISSIGGSITLFKVTLSNLLIYDMFLFRMPKVLLGRLDHLRSNFLWEEEDTSYEVE